MNENYKQIIAENLNNVLENSYIPELGEPKKGKVRDIYFVGDKVIMITSDKVSAFDHVLDRCIPFKGAVLNGISTEMMKLAEMIVPTAMKDSPDPHVIVQKRMQNIGIECIVRGYVWGSMAKAYEKGEREFCGIKLPEGLMRYDKLEELLFTPTTKATVGHDENLTFEQMKEIAGNRVSEDARRVSLALFKMYSDYAEDKGLILIDTKYEFGFPINGEICLIDETTTPDSSRFCEIGEYDHGIDLIAQYKLQTDCEKIPDVINKRFKIKELSKQFVRDVLLEQGYEEGKLLPSLTDEQVIETSLRYINLFEKITGKNFDFKTARNTKQRIYRNLVDKGYIHGGCAALMAASNKDEEHCNKITDELQKQKVPFIGPFYVSAHKETQKVLDYIKHLEESIEPIVIIASAGRSNGLGPVIAGNTKFPVIACNPYSDIASYQVDVHSSLRMPSNLPMAFVLDPKNAAQYAKKILDLAKSI